MGDKHPPPQSSMTSCEGLGTDYMYAWGGGGWELDLGPQSMWYILVWPGLQAIPLRHGMGGGGGGGR